MNWFTKMLRRSGVNDHQFTCMPRGDGRWHVDIYGEAVNGTLVVDAKDEDTAIGLAKIWLEAELSTMKDSREIKGSGMKSGDEHEGLVTVWYWDWRRHKTMFSFGFSVHAFTDPFGINFHVWIPFGELRFGKGA